MVTTNGVRGPKGGPSVSGRIYGAGSLHAGTVGKYFFGGSRRFDNDWRNDF